jgi:RHS repeat-associated protein
MKRTLYSLLLTLLVAISGLQTAQAGRMYDPEVSRFLSIDPALHEQMPQQLLANHPRLLSDSPYSYGYNNPLRFTDPDGKTPWDLLDIAFAVMSVKDAIKNPTWSNIGWAIADVGALAPLVPSTRGFRMGLDALNTIPNWKKSEQFVEGLVEGAEAQKRFLNNGAVKGSSVVDVWDAATKTAFEVKNYSGSLSKGKTSGLLSSMNKQYSQRLKNLP